MHSNIHSGNLHSVDTRLAEQQAMYKEGTYVVAAFFGVLMLVVITVALGLYHFWSDYHSYDKCTAMVAGLPALEDEETGKRKQSTTLAFRNVGYTLKGRDILRNVTGMAPAGEILAIMGPSGSGESKTSDKPKGDRRGEERLMGICVLERGLMCVCPLFGVQARVR